MDAVTEFFRNVTSSPQFIPCVVIFIVSFLFGLFAVLGTGLLNKEHGRKRSFSRRRMVGKDRFFDEKIEEKLSDVNYDPVYLEDEQEHHASNNYKMDSIY